MRRLRFLALRWPLATWAIAAAIAIAYELVRGLDGASPAALQRWGQPAATWSWGAVSALFMHADRAHLLSNALVLLAAGPAVERRLGAGPLVLVFVGFGALANAAAAAVLPAGAVLVGASGGVSALLGAWVALERRWIFAGLFFAMQLAGAAIDGSAIAWSAHLVGFALGLAYGLRGSG